MSVFDEPDPMLDDHINKCRCCFRTLIDDQSSVKITKTIEQKFLDLTGVDLVESEIFSSHICQLCDRDLERFQNLRKDLVQKQRRLYSVIGLAESFTLKSETNEFIDCNPAIQEGILEGVLENDAVEDRNELETSRVSINFQCDNCNFEALEKDELEKHLKVHSSRETQMFFCEMCGLSYGKRHLLNRHVKVKHTTKERRFRCSFEKCGKLFYTTAGLKKHSETHSAKALPCEYCGKLFSCLNNLRTHLYYHAEPKFTCDFEGCGKKFFMRKLLRSHIKVHQGQKDFGCDYCEKSYFFQAHLKRHVISMHMKLKIDCELCPSSFARKETYRNHIINQHTNLSVEKQESILAKIRSMKVEEYRNTS